jgi:hypothetical protein
VKPLGENTGFLDNGGRVILLGLSILVLCHIGASSSAILCGRGRAFSQPVFDGK